MTTIGAGTFVSLLYYLYKKHQLREHPIRMFEEGKMQCLKPSVETDHTSDKQKVKEVRNMRGRGGRGREKEKKREKKKGHFFECHLLFLAQPMIPRDEEQARFASILNKARRGYYVVVTGEVSQLSLFSFPPSSFLLLMHVAAWNWEVDVGRGFLQVPSPWPP